MEYLSTDEIKGNNEARKCVSAHISQSIKHNFPLQILSKYQPDKNAKILDAGTASGAFLQQLNEAGYRNLYGLDLENYMSVKVPLKDFKTADFNTDTFPFADNSFDVITAWCVIAHLENPYHFLRETHRILKKGGFLIVTLPHVGSASERSFFRKNGEFIAYKPNNNHITIWTSSLVRKTTSKYFDFLKEEFLLKNKIFKGFRGRLRKLYSRLSPSIARRWGSKIAYVLKNKTEPS